MISELPPNSHGRLRWRLAAASALGILVIVGTVCFVRLRNPTQAPEEVPFTLRGEPIVRSETTNAQLEATNIAPPQKRKRPKPGSFPQRMVQLQAQLEGLEPSPPGLTNRMTMFQANTNIRPATLPAGPPQVEGYAGIEMSRLSNYDFDLAKTILNGSDNMAEATAKTLRQIPPSIQALNGTQVAVRGFMLPLQLRDGVAVEFLLMRDQALCCFGAVPKINEWISVRAIGKGVKPLMDQPLTVCGTLQVGDFRENGYFIGVYKMEAEKTFMDKDR